MYTYNYKYMGLHKENKIFARITSKVLVAELDWDKGNLLFDVLLYFLKFCNEYLLSFVIKN